jgi:hypothetical protein
MTGVISDWAWRFARAITGPVCPPHVRGKTASGAPASMSGSRRRCRTTCGRKPCYAWFAMRQVDRATGCTDGDTRGWPDDHLGQVGSHERCSWRGCTLSLPSFVPWGILGCHPRRGKKVHPRVTATGCVRGVAGMRSPVTRASSRSARSTGPKVLQCTLKTGGVQHPGHPSPRAHFVPLKRAEIYEEVVYQLRRLSACLRPWTGKTVDDLLRWTMCLHRILTVGATEGHNGTRKACRDGH